MEQGIHRLRDVAAMQVAAAEVFGVCVASQVVYVVRPRYLERQALVELAAESEAAEKSQVHAAATRKQGDDLMPAGAVFQSVHDRDAPNFSGSAHPIRRTLPE